MRLILHHLKKDIRCLRLLLWLWFILLLVNSLLMRSGLDRFVVTGEGSHTLGIAHSLLYMLQQLLLIVTVCQLVHVDGLAGTTAFWLTRPIARTELLLSKALFVLLLLTLPALLVESAVMWLNAIPASLWPAALAELVVLQSALFVLPAMLLAALTANLARLSVAILASLISFFLLHYTVLATAMALGAERKQQAVMSGMLLAAIVVTGSCALLIVYQYLSRKTARAGAVAMLGMCLVIASMNFWRWDFLTDAAPLSAGSPLNPDSVNLVLRRNRGTASYESHGFRDTNTRRIMGWFDFLGAPRGVLIELVGLQATLQFPDGRQVTSGSDNPLASLFYFYSEIYQKEISRVLQSLQEANVLNEPDRIYNPATFPLLEIDLDAFRNYKYTSGVYEAEAELRANQLQVTARVPLSLGSRYVDDSGEATLLNIVPHPDGWILTMRESTVRRWIQRNPPKGIFYLLRNRASKEGVLGRPYPADVFGRFTLDRVLVNHSPIYFTTTNVSDYHGPPLTEEWLQQAELLRVEIRNIGHFSKSVRAEGFVMESR